MAPISAEPQPQLTRALKPATAGFHGGASAASAVFSGNSIHPDSAVTQADLQRGNLTGLRLGPYQLAQRIGHGGMGQVFLARHQALGKQFAIKFLAGDILQNSDAERRFQEEITSLGKLQHPNILSAVDAGRSGDVHYLVTEYVDGKDLARVVAEQGPLQPDHARDFLRQAAAGLACAHAHGFVHRDIKPSNLIVDAHGILRLLDFGLVRNQQQTDDVTSVGQLLGTIDFLSPEQAADGRSADCRSDLYSIGCTLLFLLTGKPPYSGERFASIAAKIHGHLFVTPPALRDPQTEASSHIPTELSEILHRLLQKNPADRFQSAEELIETLDRQQKISANNISLETKPLNSRTPASKSARNSLWPKGMAVAAVALTTLLIAGPLRSAVKAAREADKSTVASTTSATASATPDLPATNQSSISTESSNAASQPEDNGVVKPNESPEVAEPIVAPSTMDNVTEEVPKSETASQTPLEPTAENQTEEESEATTEAEEKPPTEPELVSGDTAETAEFRAAGNVNSRQMVLPGKSLSGQAGRLLKRGPQKNQE